MDEEIVIAFLFIMILLVGGVSIILGICRLVVLHGIKSQQNSRLDRLEKLLNRLGAGQAKLLSRTEKLEASLEQQAEESPQPASPPEPKPQPAEPVRAIKVVEAAKPDVPKPVPEMPQPKPEPMAKPEPAKQPVTPPPAKEPEKQPAGKPAMAASKAAPKQRQVQPQGPSELETKAMEIIKKVWQWILFGGDYEAKGVSMEYALASTWLIRFAITIILVGVGFFLKLSIENNYINETGRVTLSILAGLGMLVGGLKLTGKKYHIIGLGLLGGGIATLYFSVFAAFHMYHLVDALPAFALMILITVVTGFLSVRLNSLLTAVIGVIGGYFTPVMLSTGVPNFPGLYGYMLLLGIGVLAIARYKEWVFLNIMSLIFTYVIALGALKDYESSDFPVVITFFSLFFLLFSAIPIIYNLAHKGKSTLIELFMMLTNAAIFVITAYILIDKEYDYQYAAIVTVGMALFYIAQIYAFLYRKLEDRNLLIMFSGLAATCITLTIPILLDDHWVTGAWAIQAFVFLWMSSKMRSNFLRFTSYLLYVMTFLHLVSFDGASFGTGTTEHYWADLLERFSSMGLLTLSLAGAYWLQKQEKTDVENPIITEANDIPGVINYGTVAKVFFWLGFATLFIYLHFEFSYFSKHFFVAMRSPLLTMIWLGALVFFLHCYRKTKSMAYTTLLVIFSCGLGLKLLFFDLPGWDLLFHRMIFDGNYSMLDASMRLLDFAPIIALFAFATLLYSKDDDTVGSRLFGTAALGLLFAYLTLELSTFLHCYAPGSRDGGISVLWSIFALSFTFWGIRKDLPSLRYTGLALFLITVIKIFCVDLSRLSQVYRILAFIMLGLVVLGGAFIYVKFKDFFQVETTEKESDNEKLDTTE